MNVKGKKVYVGLSGGVDSAVTATLLKDAGADVTGVFIQGWYPPGMPCTWQEDRRDAMRVAARLGIPFTTLDASEEYKQGVIDYLLREYKAGRTPNPDVMCNREVKFGAFYQYARSKGADMIATGHYARTADGRLYRGIDHTKDQSYFLWAIPKEALAHTLFPLGERMKTDTRALAARYGLPNAGKRDSQGICFLGSISVEDFLRDQFGAAEGVVMDEGGVEIGRHDGAILHTIGERLSLSQGPWYVVRKNIEDNTLTVSRTRTHPTITKSIALTECNWFSDVDPATVLSAQYRYHGPRLEGTFTDDRRTFIPSNTPEEEIALGQSLVIYRDDECIGGGIIG